MARRRSGWRSASEAGLLFDALRGQRPATIAFHLYDVSMKRLVERVPQSHRCGRIST
jgi:hypothetical protein